MALQIATQARAAGSGLVRLFRGGADWASAFEFTTDGFVRSFAAPLLALPLYVGAVAVVGRSGAGLTAADASLWSAGLAHLIDALGFPLLLAFIAGPLRAKEGYAAFVIVNNWAALYLNVVLLACSPLTLLGADGVAAFSWASLLLLCLSVALTWRIARETLTHELAPIVLVVVLAVASGAMADEAAKRMLGLAG